MKRHRFVYGILAFWLVLSLSVNSAIAGKPRTCAVVPATPCGSGGTCVVNVSETGTNPHTTVDNNTIKVVSGTRIEWSTTSGSFIVTFGASHPFPAATAGTFVGTPGHNSGETATSTSSSDVCYQYSRRTLRKWPLCKNRPVSDRHQRA